MRTNVLAALLAAAAFPLPAHAAGLTVSIVVADDLSACATVTSPAPVDAAGWFAAAGYAAGPGTIVAPAGGAAQIVMAGDTWWRGCVNGAYAGATTGRAEYAVALNASGGDDLTMTHCVVAGGMVTCS